MPTQLPDAAAVAAFYKGTKEGNGYRIPCPAHGGKDANLKIWDSDSDGWLGATCFSHGCEWKDITDAIRRDMGLPAFKPGEGTRPTAAKTKPKETAPFDFKKLRWGTWPGTGRTAGIRREARRFYYREPGGRASIVVLRNDGYAADGKPREPGDKGKWINQLWVGDADGKPVSLGKLEKGAAVAWKLPPDGAFREYPYRIEKFTPGRKGKTLIVEGEEKADAAAAVLPDWNVLTWRGGSSRARKTAGIWNALKGQDVYLFPDNDIKGREAMKTIAKHVHAAGAASVRTVSVSPSKPDTWDVADAVREEGKVSRKGIPGEGMDAYALEAFIADGAVEFTPEPEPETGKKEKAFKWEYVKQPPERSPESWSRLFRAMGLDFRNDTRSGAIEYSISTSSNEAYFDGQTKGNWKRLNDVFELQLLNVLNEKTGTMKIGKDGDTGDKTASRVPLRAVNQERLGSIIKQISVLPGRVYDALQKDFFDNVPEYEPEIDSDGRIANRILPFYLDNLFDTSGTPLPIVEWAFGSLIIGGYARARRIKEDSDGFMDGFKRDVVVVLSGDEGLGKSILVKLICPSTKYFNDSFSLRMDYADQVPLTAGKLFVEISEFTTRKSEEDDVKKLLVQTQDEVRWKYDKHSKKIPRTPVFCGTSNRKEILLSGGGNRRFAVVHVRALKNGHGGRLTEIENGENLKTHIERDFDRIWSEAIFLHDTPHYRLSHVPANLKDYTAPQLFLKEADARRIAERTYGADWETDRLAKLDFLEAGETGNLTEAVRAEQKRVNEHLRYTDPVLEDRFENFLYHNAGGRFTVEQILNAMDYDRESATGRLGNRVQEMLRKAGAERAEHREVIEGKRGYFWRIPEIENGQGEESG